MSRLPETATKESPEAMLRQFFRRGGYVRVVDRARRKEIGPLYKKGYEVRLVVKTRDELLEVRRLLRAVGFTPAATFRKHNRIVQPIYGKAAAEWFLAIPVE